MSRRLTLAALAVALVATLFAGSAYAFVAAKESKAALASRSLVSSRTSILSEIEGFESVRPIAGAAMQNGWEAFRMGISGEWQGEIDKRSGRIGYAEGAGIPWVPGRGNDLRVDAIYAHSRTGQVDLAAMESAARAFLPRVAELLGVDPSQLRLNQGALGPAGRPRLVRRLRRRASTACVIEGARVVFRVNNGNLIQFGSENLPARDAEVPARSSNRAAGPRSRSPTTSAASSVGDTLRRRRLAPPPAGQSSATTQPPTASARQGPRPRAGLAVHLPPRGPSRHLARPRIDADERRSARVPRRQRLRLGDRRRLSHRQSRLRAGAPLPFANVATGGYTNSAGVFSGTTGTTTLNGQYVRITDSCGAISKAADASGRHRPRHLGRHRLHDAGHRRRRQHPLRAHPVLPRQPRQGSRPRLAALEHLAQRPADRQRQHQPDLQRLLERLDDQLLPLRRRLRQHRRDRRASRSTSTATASTRNDGNGSSPDNGTGETYGDFTAALATHNSCVGTGFLASQLRRLRRRLHLAAPACATSTGPSTPRNTPLDGRQLHPDHLPAAPRSPNYSGPCGREGHCESYVSSEALWDLANRDLPNPG